MKKQIVITIVITIAIISSGIIVGGTGTYINTSENSNFTVKLTLSLNGKIMHDGDTVPTLKNMCYFAEVEGGAPPYDYEFHPRGDDKNKIFEDMPDFCNYDYHFEGNWGNPHGYITPYVIVTDANGDEATPVSFIRILINKAPYIEISPKCERRSDGDDGTQYVYTAKGYDPDSDKLVYAWDFDGNRATIEYWLDGDSRGCTLYHGEYNPNACVFVKDTYGATSDWSNLESQSRLKHVENLFPTIFNFFRNYLLINQKSQLNQHFHRLIYVA